MTTQVARQEKELKETNPDKLLVSANKDKLDVISISKKLKNTKLA
jgi:hypothetical protein